MAALLLLFPLFLIGIGLVTSIMPAGSINLPHRDYWLAPERRRETNRYLARHMAWFACAMTAFFIALNWFVVEANRRTPPRLVTSVWFLFGPFLVFVLAWIVVLIAHFSRLPSEEDARGRAAEGAKEDR